MSTLLTHEDVVANVSMADAIGAMRSVFREEGQGRVSVPPLTLARSSRGWLRVMPAVMEDSGLAGLKTIIKVNGTGVRYVVLLFDAATTELLCVMDATALTTLRTAATSAVAADLLAAPGASEVACLGSGPEARAQLEALCQVRSVAAARVFSPTPANREAFAREMGERLGIDVQPVASAREALAGADIGYAATSSTTPFVDGEWLGEGIHFNAVGATKPEQRELLPNAFSVADRVVVDTRESVMAEAGDVLDARAAGTLDPDGALELSEVAAAGPAARAPGAVTLFKSVGSAVQDLALAGAIHRQATRRGAGLDLGEFPRLKVKAA